VGVRHHYPSRSYWPGEAGVGLGVGGNIVFRRNGSADLLTVDATGPTCPLGSGHRSVVQTYLTKDEARSVRNALNEALEDWE
jgi:hypothetical protein